MSTEHTDPAPAESAAAGAPVEASDGTDSSPPLKAGFMARARRHWPVLVAIAAAALIVIAIPNDWIYAPPPALDEHADHDAGLRYACPMLCVITDHPGTCPQCGMEMEPIDDSGGYLTRAQEEMIGLTTARVEVMPLTRRLTTFGRIVPDEARRHRITAWIGGRVERVYVNVVGERVEAGAPLIDLYSPALYGAQQEHLANVESARNAPASLREMQERMAAFSREKLMLLGLAAEQVAEIERDGARTIVTIRATDPGVVTQRTVYPGQYVKEGELLIEVAQLEQVWLMLDIYERDLPFVVTGQTARVTTESAPGKLIDGEVDFVEPQVSPRTRTSTVRITLPNELLSRSVAADGAASETWRFVPGMFAKVEMHVAIGADGRAWLGANRTDDLTTRGQQPRLLAIPSGAILDGGKRTVVYVQVSDSAAGRRFDLREVRVGPNVRSADPTDLTPYRQIVQGLKPGDVVALNGNFLLDSQAQLQGKPSLFFPDGQVRTADPHAGH